MERFRYGKIFLLGFGFFGISVLWALYNAYVPIFLKDFALSYLVIGFIMTIDNIFAIVMLPYIGALSDQTRTRIGRRMPYILTGAPTGALFFALIPVARNLHSLLFMMTTIIIMNFAMALFRSPVIALMPDITPSRYRSQANGIINFMGGLGALLVYFIGKPLYDRNYALPFYLGALILFLSSLLVVIFIKEPEVYKRKEPNTRREKLIRQREESSFHVALHTLLVHCFQRDRDVFHELCEIRDRNKREHRSPRFGVFLPGFHDILHSGRFHGIQDRPEKNYDPWIDNDNRYCGPHPLFWYESFGNF